MDYLHTRNSGPYPVISEQLINSQVEILGSSKNQTQVFEEFQKVQPEIVSFIISPTFDILSSAEKDYLCFLVIVIYKSAEQTYEIPPILIDDILDYEESNWKLYEEKGGAADTFSIFYPNYPEEDLLAFVEDSVNPDENELVTATGQIPLFIGLKSVIDCIAKRN